jgi:hypothetical protein
VKENRRALFDALDALPWRDVPIAHTATDTGHGRITTRTIQVLPAPEDLPFPHVSQVFLIERHVSDLTGKPVSAVAALGVASPAPGQASPSDLAGYVREQWSIESLHWLRSPGVTWGVAGRCMRRRAGGFYHGSPRVRCWWLVDVHDEHEIGGSRGACVHGAVAVRCAVLDGAG